VLSFSRGHTNGSGEVVLQGFLFEIANPPRVPPDDCSNAAFERRP
jgi:hypothetical protein